MISKITNQVFLSYTSKHKSLGNAVALKLENHQLSVWDAYSTPTGSPIDTDIQNALDMSDSMIAILDQHSFSSSLVRKELDYAFFDKRYKNRLLPVFIENEKKDFSRLPWILNRLKVIRIKETGKLNYQATQIVDAFLHLLSTHQE